MQLQHACNNAIASSATRGVRNLCLPRYAPSEMPSYVPAAGCPLVWVLALLCAPHLTSSTPNFLTPSPATMTNIAQEKAGAAFAKLQVRCKRVANSCWHEPGASCHPPRCRAGNSQPPEAMPLRCDPCRTHCFVGLLCRRPSTTTRWWVRRSAACVRTRLGGANSSSERSG